MLVFIEQIGARLAEFSLG